jgi:broad specificity phosphatase PhoE
VNSLTIIRHAETDWSLQDKHTGLSDIPLNVQGEIQAKRLKSTVNPSDYDHIFVSPLKRALTTAEFAGLMEKATIEPDLVEWDYGSYEGLTLKQIQAEDPDWNIFTHGAPGGESISDAVNRANRLISKFNHLSGNVLIVSSGHISRLIASCWVGEAPAFGKHIALHPASCSVLGYDKIYPAIISWNINLSR